MLRRRSTRTPARSPRPLVWAAIDPALQRSPQRRRARSPRRHRLAATSLGPRAPRKKPDSLSPHPGPSRRMLAHPAGTGTLRHESSRLAAIGRLGDTTSRIQIASFGQHEPLSTHPATRHPVSRIRAVARTHTPTRRQGRAQHAPALRGMSGGLDSAEFERRVEARSAEPSLEQPAGGSATGATDEEFERRVEARSAEHGVPRLFLRSNETGH